MFGSGWKGKTGGLLTSLFGVIESVQSFTSPESGASLEGGLTKVAIGLGIFGIRDANGRK